jgi:hypothetical protein
MNKYTDVSVSAYHPMTTQEIWAPAAAMRQQHNAADEKLQTQIAELDKVNPLDVHYDKAQKIKSDLLKQIDAQSTTLANEGFNGNTTSGVFRTNRELREQFSPTGELGQINAAKTAYDTEKATYLDDATKVSKIGREQALKNWNNYAKNKYTGYSEDGKKISNIGALGSPAYQDYETDRNQYHALLGKVTGSARASGHGIVTDPTTGLMMMVNRGGNVVHSDNIDALNNAMKGMKDKWVSEAGEGRKWADAAGWDPSHTNYRINQDFNAMKEISNVDNRTENYDVLSGQTPGKNPTQPIVPTTIYDPSTQKTVGESIKKIDFNSIGTNRDTTKFSERKTFQGYNDAPRFKSVPAGKNTYKDIIKDPIQQQIYKKSYEKLIANGKIPKGQDINDINTAKVVGFYMNKYAKIPTIANDVILPDSATNSQQFMGQFDKKPGAQRDAEAQRDLNNGYRSIIDPVTKQELTPDEFRAKGYKVKYIGYDSHLSYNGYNFKGSNGKKQTVLTHKVEIIDDKGNSLGQAPMTRSKQEMDTPEFKKSYQISQVYRNAVEKFGDWVTPRAADDTKIKFKENGSFDIIYNGNLYEDATGPEYEYIMDKAMTEKQIQDESKKKE